MGIVPRKVRILLKVLRVWNVRKTWTFGALVNSLWIDTLLRDQTDEQLEKNLDVLIKFYVDNGK